MGGKNPSERENKIDKFGQDKRFLLILLLRFIRVIGFSSYFFLFFLSFNLVFIFIGILIRIAR